MQCTISKSCEIKGIGLHSGRACRVTLKPAPINSGRRFTVGSNVIPAHYTAIVDSNYCTVLGKGEAHVATVEHLLAAAMGLGVDNLIIDVEGDEIPILDGSAAPWVQTLIDCGIRTQGAKGSH